MRKRGVGIFVVVLLSLVCAGCAGTLMKDYGSFEPDKAITQAFETYQVNPEFNYYITGSDVYPNAIMGLNKKYTLAPSLWRPWEMTPERLKELVWGMQKRTNELGLSLRGWSMRDERGVEIGVWYSILFATTSIKVEGNTVTVYRPPMDIYRENGREEREIPLSRESM